MSNEWDGKTDRRTPPPERWHLKKEFQVGQLVTILVVAAGVFSYISTLEKRITLLEAADVSFLTRFIEFDARYNRERVEFRNDVINKFSAIDAKLDALLSQRNK